MFGPRLTLQGNIRLCYLQCSPAIPDNVVWQIALCSSVVCSAGKCEVCSVVWVRTIMNYFFLL